MRQMNLEQKRIHPDDFVKSDKDSIDKAFTDIVYFLSSITEIARGTSIVLHNKQAGKSGYYIEKNMADLRARCERRSWLGSNQVSKVFVKFLTTLNSSIKFTGLCSGRMVYNYHIRELSGVFLSLAEDLENLLGDMSTELEKKSRQEKIEGIEDLTSCLELGLKI